MTPFLLDVSVLMALMDRLHANHERAHTWFAAGGATSWATCPITQNAVLRIFGHPHYLNSPGTPAVVAALLARFIDHPGHRFWPDNITLLDQRIVSADRLRGPSQITDTYLLALAVANGGKLATFDRRLATHAVVHGVHRLEFID